VSNRIIRWRILSFCCDVMLFSLPSAVLSAPTAQTKEVTLTILNQSEQTICNVQIAAPTDVEWQENHLGDEVIGPDESYSFPIDPGIYDVLLSDCAGDQLLDTRGLELFTDYELSLTQNDIDHLECDAYNAQAMQSYVLGRYDETIEAFQLAAICYGKIGDLVNQGIMLNNIGTAYGAQGRNAEELAQYEAALVIRRMAGDRVGEGVTLLNIGTAYTEQRRYADALEAYEAALVIAREVGDRTSEGITLAGIGQIYAGQERNAEALAQYEAALVVLREVGNRTTEGRTLGSIAVVYANQGRYAEALEAYEEALVIAGEVGDRASEGQILNNIGRVYHDQGRFAEALVQYEAALMIRREVGDRSGEGATVGNIGGLYRSQGRYAEALDQLEAALAIRREIGDRTGEGQTLHNIGLVYHAQGRYTEALIQYDAALIIAREVGGFTDEATILNNIGQVYQVQGRNTEAIKVYETALAFRREAGDRAGEGQTLNGIGTVYDVQGRYTEALEVYEAALAIAREVGDRAGEGAILNNIAAVYYAQGRYADALVQYEMALAILREVGDRAGEGITLVNIGWLYAKLEQYEDALSSYQQAMAVFDDLRAVAGSESARTSFIAQHANVYDQVMRIYLQQNLEADAFRISERGRARTFLDSLATGQVELSDNAAADLLAREIEAYAVRQAAQEALAKAKALDPPDAELVADLEEQLAIAEADYDDALSAIHARSNHLADLVPARNNNVLTLEEVQAQLDEQTTLVSYWMLDDITVAFIVTVGDFIVVELPDATRDTISAAVDDLEQWRNLDNPHPRPLQNLYKWLVAPLTEHLTTAQVAIIPHQLLHYVPFAALTDGTIYFGQQHTLSQLPSASVLPFLNQNAAWGEHSEEPSALVFGNPQTDLPTLPYAETEATAVATFFHTNVYTGTAASELQLRTLVSGTNVLHLAAHGSYSNVNPLNSAIYLAVSEEEGYDGLLETHEIFGLPLQGNDLVVLSACETNVGELSRGDEMVGLTRAFFFTGASTVIASLWNVNDAATGTLMTSFYQHWLQGGMTKAGALQAAQADVRANPNWTSPFYWAGFVLNGLPGQ
jgi:CHAT domain-containing protein/Tfp pilus assembly protein PilF